MTGPSRSISEATGERRKVTQLIRWVALFVAIPTLSIGGVLLLIDPESHFLHMTGFLILGAAALAAMALAPKLAARWVQTEE